MMEMNNKDEKVEYDEQEQKSKSLIDILSEFQRKRIRQRRYNIYALCFILLVISIISFSLIKVMYHSSILQESRMRELGKIHESIHNETELIHDKTQFLAMNNQCPNIPEELRFDCHPEDGASELECLNRRCCWMIDNIMPMDDEHKIKKVPLNVPYCFYPYNWKLYNYENITDLYESNNTDFEGYLRKNQYSSYYKNDLPLIKMESTSIDDSILRVKIYDPTKPRYEPLYPIRTNRMPFDTNDVQSPKYKFEIGKSNPGFRIRRNMGSKPIIFDSLGIGGFIFADQFLQMSAILPSSNIYGLGEHRTNLKLDTNWQILTIFNKDQPPTEHANLYGSHPFYLIIEETGLSHGVLLLNSNAMDIILQPKPAITYRTIGGIFDFYFFMGPTPADVLRQYAQIVSKPFLPPYWSLGFHLCRFGYGSVKRTREIVEKTRKAGIPFDTQWNDLDYMNNSNDFTYDNITYRELPEFVSYLHQLKMHYVPLIDPGISGSEPKGSYPPYDEGIRRNIFVQDNNTGLPFVGKVWNRASTVWPDFTNPDAKNYWYTMMKKMHNDFQYDGAWIDMNEPSNFYNGRINGCTPNKLDQPPYMPNVVGNSLSTKTLCMNAKHYLGWHYNIHNMYATAEAHQTYSALMLIRKQRPFILSRGTWVGQGAYAAHWTGDIYSSWHDLKMSVPEILSFSLYQIPMVGADICGFDGNTTVALCNRWMQLGAFYPFSRNHNSDDTIDQDPVTMGDLVVRSSIEALTIRYRLLPYLYTLFYLAHSRGDTVARPMFVEFPKDIQTWNIDTQFLWGSALLIVPVLDEGKTKVEAYLPQGYWYSYYTLECIKSKGEFVTLDAPLDTIPLLIRGGSILPAQEPGKTTAERFTRPLEFLIALDEYERASGEWYTDDGECIECPNDQTNLQTIRVDNSTLKILRPRIAIQYNIPVSKIEVMGVSRNIQTVRVNGENTSFNYSKSQRYLVINKPKFNDGMNEIVWSDIKSQVRDKTDSYEKTMRSFMTMKSNCMESSAAINVPTIFLFVIVYLMHF